VTVLVGEAGTGKGVVLGAAREAWERDGHRVIGTAVAGAAAQRLGTEAGIKETMTADALITPRRAGAARAGLAVVVMDEAGMADTRRLAQVVELTRESGREARPRRRSGAAVLDRRRRAVRRDSRTACRPRG
jgi:ATP-dependent exoDNAse (exonuclease V) alpha subunit